MIKIGIIYKYPKKIKKGNKALGGDKMNVLVHVKTDVMLVAMAKKRFNCANLAKASGVSRATISYIRNGKSCKPDIAGKLAEALEVSVEELIDTKKE